MKKPSRRNILLGLSSLIGAGALAKFTNIYEKFFGENMIQQQFSLDFQWPTFEPFIFCVHHYDYFPKGNGQLGVEKSHLSGRNIGQDFDPKDGFRMYHGDDVPGFPVHPHRGFETVTIVRKGYVDHADSMGAAGRYGQGDVQWMTAGRGVQHSEMFPLIKQDAENTVELFQIWLNLPRANKMASPYFTMFWSEKIPQLKLDQDRVQLSLIAGEFDSVKAPPPPPDSWASNENSEIGIWLIKIQKNGQIILPKTKNSINRALYFFAGKGLKLNGQTLSPKTGFRIDSQQAAELTATDTEVEVLVLQARAIGEPVVQHGPFVMTTREEILQTFQDYQKTQFGGWSWPRHDMVHGDKLERFAKYPDGRIEKPEV